MYEKEKGINVYQARETPLNEVRFVLNTRNSTLKYPRVANINDKNKKLGGSKKKRGEK